MEPRFLYSRVAIIALAAGLLGACRETPAGPGSISTRIPRSTVVIPAGDLSHVDSITAAGVFHVATGTRFDSVSAGDVLVSEGSAATPHGFLRRVVEVERVGGTTILYTDQAALTDAIEEGRVEISEPLLLDSIPAGTLPDGVEIHPAGAGGAPGSFVVSMDNVVLHDEDGSNATTNDRIALNGRLILTPRLDLDVAIRDNEVTYFSFATGGEITVEAEVTALTHVAGLTVEHMLTAPLVMKPIVVMTPIPIVIVPVLTISVGASGEVSVGLQTGGSYTLDATAGVEFDDGDWTRIGTAQHDAAFSPLGPAARASLRSYVRVPLELLLYGVAGPFVSLTPYAELVLDPQADPWWSRWVGIDAHTGGVISILGRNLERFEDQVVLSYRRHVGSATDDFPASTATLDVAISGLPAAGAASVLVHGSGFARTLTRSATLLDLPAGTYTVTSSTVEVGGVEYAPVPETQTVQLSAGETEVVGVVYAPVAAPVLRIAVTPTGVQARSPGQSQTYVITVEDGEGNPVVGAVVRGTDALMDEEFTTSPTNTSGITTRTTTVPPGKMAGTYGLTFRASLAGFADSDVVLRDIAVNPSSLAIEVSPLGAITLAIGQSQRYDITVRDAAGQPVSGAVVSGTDGVAGQSHQTEPTDAAGQTTRNVTVPAAKPEGDYDITFQASRSGYANSDVAIRHVLVQHAQLSITVSPTGRQVARPGQSVQFNIVVRDPSGAPVSGAVVGGMDEVTGQSYQTLPTNSNGETTRTTPVGAGKAVGVYGVTFQASRAGYRSSQTDRREIEVELPRLVLSVEPAARQILFPGGSVSYLATVRDGAGQPVSGAIVSGSDELTAQNYQTAPTNGAGQTNFPAAAAPGTAEGVYAITFRATRTGYTPSETLRREIEIQLPRLSIEVNPTARVTLPLGGSQTYTITVRDPAGFPVSGAVVAGTDSIADESYFTPPTNSLGQTTRTTTVPAWKTDGIHIIGFEASRAGYRTSVRARREVDVDVPPGSIRSTLETHLGAPASAAGAEHLLYATPRRTLTGVNPATFSNVPPGTYLVEGYFNGTFFGEELWTSAQVQVTSDRETRVTLRRNYPYAIEVRISNDATGAVINPGQQIPAGTTVRAEVTVRNEVPGTPLSSRVRFVFDRSQSGTFDFEQLANPLTVQSNSTRVFTFRFTPTSAGQYYYALAVTTTVSSPTLTDSWTWTRTFSR